MSYREIIAVCSEIHTKHINTLCGQNIELLNVKLVVRTVSTGLGFRRLFTQPISIVFKVRTILESDTVYRIYSVVCVLTTVFKKGERFCFHVTNP